MRKARPAPRDPDTGISSCRSLPLVLIFVVFYFLLIRPQQQARKRHMEMVAHLKKDDVVVTSGGLIGKVKSRADDEVRVELVAERRCARGARAPSPKCAPRPTRRPPTIPRRS